MAEYVIDNAFAGNSTTVVSQPIRMGEGNNSLQVGLTLISGTTIAGAAPIALVVELSSDLSNWKDAASTTTVFSNLTGPTFAEFNFTGISQRYARVKVTMAAAGAGIINVSAVPNRT